MPRRIFVHGNDSENKSEWVTVHRTLTDTPLPSHLSPSTKQLAEKVEAKSERPWRHFVAGGIGGVIGATITCPLEVVKTRLQSRCNHLHNQGMAQVCRNIAAKDGVIGFWKGWGPMLAGVVPARAVYFSTYNASKSALLPRFGNTAPTHMLSALAAGSATVTLINPIWVIKTRLQLQSAENHGVKPGDPIRYRNSFHAVQVILRDEGLRGFFRGVVPSYWGITENAVHFVLYERLKKVILERSGDDELSPQEYLGAAASAKVVASVSTYPHEVIRTRMRERGAQELYKTAIGCVRKVWAEEGVRGLYAGMHTHLMRVVPNTAIIFFTYEKVSAWLA